MKDSDFIDISAYLRVQEKRLLDSAGIERAIDAANAAEALRMLSQNTDYDFAALRTASEYEARLKDELRRVYSSAWAMAGENRAAVDVLAAKYDFHNVKTAVKAKYFAQRTESPYFYVSDIKAGDIEELAGDPTGKTELPEHIAEAVLLAVADYEDTQNPQSIDIAADKAMFARQLKLCESLENSFITDYVRMSIDFYNIKTLLRVKLMQKGTAFLTEALMEGGKTELSFFVENYARTPAAMAPSFYYRYFGNAMQASIEAYEKTSNLSSLEKLLDNLLIAHTRQAKYLTFGAEILFAYLVSKENEIRQIRIIVTCKQNGIPTEALRERLRETYA